MSRLLRKTAMRAESVAERMSPAGGLVSKPSADEHPPTPVPEPGPPAPEPAPPAPDPEPPTPEPGPPPPQLRAVAPPLPEAEPVREDVQEPVTYLPRAGGEPREWNVWELERLARESEGRDQPRHQVKGHDLLHTLRALVDGEGDPPRLERALGGALAAQHVLRREGGQLPGQRVILVSFVGSIQSPGRRPTSALRHADELRRPAADADARRRRLGPAVQHQALRLVRPQPAYPHAGGRAAPGRPWSTLRRDAGPRGGPRHPGDPAHQVGLRPVS